MESIPLDRGVGRSFGPDGRHELAVGGSDLGVLTQLERLFVQRPRLVVVVPGVELVGLSGKRGRAVGVGRVRAHGAHAFSISFF